MSRTDQRPASPLRKTLRWGLAVSLLLHACLLAVMAFGSIRDWLNRQPLLVIQASASYEQRAVDEDVPAVASVLIEANDPAPIAIKQQVEKSLVASEQLSRAEQITALDNAANRLGRVSSENSVNDVAERLQSWLGLAPRAEQPVTTPVASEDGLVESAAPASGSDPPAAVEASPPAAEQDPFDFNTAQLHDVRRIEQPDGSRRYVCVLLDAQGRTLEVPLSEAEGEPIYTLMEKIKASPLLERIYRQVAMPLLDQLVAAEQAAAAAADAAKSQAARQEVEEREIPSEPSAEDQ